jgi:hypothetical protein
MPLVELDFGELSRAVETVPSIHPLPLVELVETSVMDHRL